MPILQNWLRFRYSVKSGLDSNSCSGTCKTVGTSLVHCTGNCLVLRSQYGSTQPLNIILLQLNDKMEKNNGDMGLQVKMKKIAESLRWIKNYRSSQHIIHDFVN